MSDSNNDPRVAATQTAGTAAIKAAERLGAFLSQVFGAPISTSVGMLQDKLAVVRWERQLQLADRVRKITSERANAGDPVPVPPRLALPIIANAALEDDDYLQNLWAYLLASAMNSETSGTVRSAFIDIIKNLEPIDIKILEYCYMRYRKERTERIARSKENRWHRVGDSIDYPVHMDDIRSACYRRFELVEIRAI